MMNHRQGLKSGNTVVVCTMAAVGSMTCGVLAGLLALGEDMPSTHAMRLARLASWLLILAGVASLAGAAAQRLRVCVCVAVVVGMVKGAQHLCVGGRLRAALTFLRQCGLRAALPRHHPLALRGH